MTFAEDMIRYAIALALLLGGFSFAEDTEADRNVVELPRPNSGRFTTAEAEARKSEILSNTPTGKIVSWKNPYTGFSIHIHSDDSVTGYGSWVRYWSSNSSKKLTVKQVRELADALPLGGNPAGILVTSEKPLKNSKVIHKILDNLFASSIQLFYVGNSEQGSADQPTTVVEPEGKEKPKSGAGGRSK